MKPKIIALYLPQFHPIPENDRWWGKGFTEWVNVRKAKPLFAGHDQPKQPLGANYYDLSQATTLRQQAELAASYGVYGMCMYHYWFNGKLLLERPAELLLREKDIPMRFCFSWANEPWARTWDGKAHQILMPQSYGDVTDWRKHFDYLLPFFTDNRYIKEDGRPFFVIYKPQSIARLGEMMQCWQKWAVEAGLPGVHFVETLRDGHVDPRHLPFAARMEFEPIRSNMQQHPFVLNYKRLRRRFIALVNKLCHTHFLLNTPFTFKEVADRAIALQSPRGTYGGAFVGWDNSPRRGLAATIISPPTRQEFHDYLRAVVEKTRTVYQTDYVFINAWNEWAEGAVLEPTEREAYTYLEVIKELQSKP